MFLALTLASLLVFALPFLYSMIQKNVVTSKIVKLACFECGFESLTCTRHPFSVRFFILVMLFLVFDVESVLLFPCLCNNILFSSYILMMSYYMFLLVLLIGLLYEWYNSMLEWA
uniref:NADH-ubiquinone oxidoreductase chain 3 n=1 Tax=Helix pomatia TaxID=6536 RepID=A0A481ZMU9_HELPO|nr:NADH dehydrogenase subunit 3 [Helix pomatia]QBL02336.1 NADH dehydrogenase subunit 3 [Helix pomatia]